MREASRRLVEGDERGSEEFLSLVARAFAPGTELHRERKIASSLLAARVGSEALAVHALAEARSSARSLDSAKLDAEKTRLIEDVRRIDPAGAVYDAPLEGYRTLSTAGVLVHDWRVGSDDVARVAAYEQAIVERMTSVPVEAPPPSDVEGMSVGERRALIAIMSRKLEERWGGSLTKEQRSLLRDYALAPDPASLLGRIREARSRALECLSSGAEVDGGYFAGRLKESKAAVEARPFEAVDDETVGLAMLYLKLVAEAEEPEKKDV